MHIGLFPGSFKPPHKGHLQMVKDAIRKDKLDKVVIIISKYPRYLDDKIQNAKEYSKQELEAHFGKYFSTKKAALTWIQSIKPKSPSIDAVTSKKIWEFYLSKIKIPSEVKIGLFFSPMINSNVYLGKELKRSTEHQYTLYKSSKDESNRRFDFIQTKYGKNVYVRIIPLKYKIDGRVLRQAILQKYWLEPKVPSKPPLTTPPFIELLI